jgi:esterase/lipase superfamily enzyme
MRRMTIGGLLRAAAVAAAAGIAAPDGAGAQADPGLLAAIGAEAAADPAAALDAVAAALARPDVGDDPRAAFDLNRLAAELLEAEGRLAEAAAVAADLARFAARNRDLLGADPAVLWRQAARLAEAAGDTAGAIRAEGAALAEQRDGVMPAEVLAATLGRLERLAGLAGDRAAQAGYAQAAAALRAPPEAPAGVRGDGRGHVEVEVFYATDRARTGSDYPAEMYGAGRGPLETGIARVTVPDRHRPGALEAPSVWRLEFSANPARHVMLRAVEPMAPDAFFAAMQDRIGTRDRREAFVFIHGYNVSFEAAARRAAQLAHDMAFGGLPILYSWPSRGSTVGYIPDAAVVQLSARRLTRFLDEVVARSGAETVHIVAHSMGNRALTEAMELMALRRGAGAPPPFGQVVFAAPDVDADLFAEMLPTIRPLAQRLTLYASESDWALAASRKLHGDAPRAGQGGAGMLAAEGIDSVDMSDLGEDMLAHGYFAGDRSALVDLVSLIWRNLDPAARCGLRPAAGASGRPVWRYERGACPDETLLAVIALLQAEGVGTPEAAEGALTRLLTDPAQRDSVAPVVARMLAP